MIVELKLSINFKRVILVVPTIMIRVFWEHKEWYNNKWSSNNNNGSNNNDLWKKHYGKKRNPDLNKENKQVSTYAFTYLLEAAKPVFLRTTLGET